MPDDSKSKAEAFKAAVEEKIQKLINDFAEGKISREQFHILYERYNARLKIADYAVMSGNPDAVEIAQGGPPTIAVKDAYMGRALGLMIYHNTAEVTLETLGTFDIPMQLLQPTLEDFTMQMLARTLVDRKVEKITKERWLLFVPGQFTTLVVLFEHEPSAMQIRELERMQHDFEQANHAKLQRSKVDPEQLAFPFRVFIKKRYGNK